VARFYLDNDVSLALASQLNQLGHDAVTARDQGASHAGDYEQLLISAQLQRVLITHNERHFRDLHSTWLLWLPHFGVNAEHEGILVIPQPPRVRRIDLAFEIDGLVRQHAHMANALLVWRGPGEWDSVGPRLAYFSRPGA
jgi:hypothetical protein